jgi:trk system potassium uptake protein TrkA
VRVAIAGAGTVGRYLAEDLGEHGHEVLLIERDAELVSVLPTPKGITVLSGDACEVATLSAAGLDTMQVMVAATGDDEDNLVVSLLAKQEFAVPRVIARVNHPKNSWLFDEAWGVDVAVSTPQLLAALIEEAVSVGALIRILQFEHGGVRLVEVTLAPGAPVAGRSVRELGLPRGATVVAVVRESHVVVPRGDTVLEAGNEVLLLVTAEAEEEVRTLLVGTP